MLGFIVHPFRWALSLIGSGTDGCHGPCCRSKRRTISSTGRPLVSGRNFQTNTMASAHRPTKQTMTPTRCWTCRNRTGTRPASPAPSAASTAPTAPAHPTWSGRYVPWLAEPSLAPFGQLHAVGSVRHGRARLAPQGEAGGADVFPAVAGLDGQPPLAGQRLQHRQPVTVGGREGQVHVLQRPLQRELRPEVTAAHLVQLGVGDRRG